MSGSCRLARRGRLREAAYGRRSVVGVAALRGDLVHPLDDGFAVPPGTCAAVADVDHVDSCLSRLAFGVHLLRADAARSMDASALTGRSWARCATTGQLAAVSSPRSRRCGIRGIEGDDDLLKQWGRS